MASTSYPAVGDGGLTDAQWATLYGAQDGIVEDYAGNACSIFRAASTDMVHIRPGKVSVNGYVLDITVSEQVYCAPVVSGNPPVTYYVAAMYDPALNIADADGGASDLGPCRLVCTTDISPAGGKAYTVLYRLVRSSVQTVNESELTDYRVWLGPSGQVAGRTSTGDPELPSGSAWPMGSRLYHASTDNEWWRVWSGSGLQWQSTRWPEGQSLPTPSTLVAQDTPARYYRMGCQVWVYGTLKRSNGQALSNGTRDITVGTLPVGVRPGRVQRFQCSTSGTGSVEVTCFNTTGELVIRPGGGTFYWIDLSAINFRASMEG